MGNLLQRSCLGSPHGRRSLGGWGPQGHRELDTTEPLRTLMFQLLHCSLPSCKDPLLVWGGDTMKDNPQLSRKAIETALPFPATCLCELAFSSIETPYGNRWNADIDRRIGLSSS